MRGRITASIEAAPVESVRRWVALAKRFIQEGRFDEARAVVEEMRGREIRGSEKGSIREQWIRRYTAILERFPPSPSPDTLPPGLAVGGPDTVTVRRPGASAALVVFGHKRWESIALHPIVAERPLHLIYLFDERGLGCGAGVASMGASYRETVRGLRTLLDSIDARQVYTLGVSRGGYSAIRYGLDLDAAAVLAFSPFVDVLHDFRRGSARGAAIVARARAVDPDAAVDLRPLIEAAAARTPIHIWYGRDVPFDCHHARYVDGAPGVRTRPLKNSPDHNSLLTVVTDGRIERALDVLLRPAATGRSRERG